MKRLAFLSLFLIYGSIALAQKQRILIVSTNRDSVGTHVSGTYLPEMAYPFQYFVNNGFEVDIVTPKGGKAAVYWRDVPPALEQIQKSELFVAKTTNTLSPKDVDPANYAAVFYPGGHGQYLDVVNDERIAALTAAIHERGGIVGTAGHGVASLINVQLKDGKYLVAGKKMTCFPHWAELKWMNISEYGKLLAFDMQEVLERRGARLVVSTFETRTEPSLTLVTDPANRIVTGSFASSAQWVAEQMVMLIKK